MADKIKLTRATKYIRTWYIAHMKRISKIYFYSDNKILTHTQQGWLEAYDQEHKRYSDIDYIFINKPASRRILNLNRKENFYIKSEECSGEYDLYLYVDGVNIKYESLTEEKEESNFYTETFIQTFKVSNIIIGEISFQMKTLEKTDRIENKINNKKITNAKKLLDEKGIYLDDYKLKQLLKADLFKLRR